MIGVDTNVLVRFFVEDDARQGELARRFMDQRTARDPVFVSAIVLAELVWALDQVYNYDRAQILAVLALLVGSANVALEREELLKIAIMQAGTNNADVADCIIARLAQSAGAATTATFDREAAKRIPGMELLT